MALKRNPGSSTIESTDASIKLLGFEGPSFVWPTVDGTSGDHMITDGAGTLSFATPSGGGSGIVLQQVIFVDGEVATTTTVMPLDDTIPENTEGAEFLAVTITPTNTNNILLIQCVAHVSVNANSHIGMALFQDATVAALASANHRQDSNSLVTHNLLHRRVAGTTSATTFKIRAGPNLTSTLTFNGRVAATRLYGGSLASYIMVTELTP